MSRLALTITLIGAVFAALIGLWAMERKDYGTIKEQRCIAQSEIDKRDAEIDTLKAKIAKIEAAREQLDTQKAQDTATDRITMQGIETYALSTPLPQSCVLDADLSQRLRNATQD